MVILLLYFRSDVMNLLLKNYATDSFVFYHRYLLGCTSVILCILCVIVPLYPGGVIWARFQRDCGIVVIIISVWRSLNFAQ